MDWASRSGDTENAGSGLSREELHRLEEQVRRAVAPGPLQLHPYAAVAEQPQPILGQGRAAGG